MAGRIGNAQRKGVYLRGKVKSRARWMSRNVALHVIASPPRGAGVPRSLEAYKAHRSEAYRVVKRVGFDGGAAFFHARRKKCSVCGEGVLWDFKERKGPCRHCGCNAWVWIEAPHWHFIGFGWLDPRHVKKVYEDACAAGEAPWVVNGRGPRKSVKDTAFYLLTHVAIPVAQEEAFLAWDKDQKYGPLVTRTRVHVVTWFGVLAYNKMSDAGINDEEEKRAALCPFDHPLVSVLWVNLDRPPPGLLWGGYVGRDDLMELWERDYGEARGYVRG